MRNSKMDLVIFGFLMTLGLILSASLFTGCGSAPENPKPLESMWSANGTTYYLNQIKFGVFAMKPPGALLDSSTCFCKAVWAGPQAQAQGMITTTSCGSSDGSIKCTDSIYQYTKTDTTLTIYAGFYGTPGVPMQVMK